MVEDCLEPTLPKEALEELLSNLLECFPTLGINSRYKSKECMLEEEKILVSIDNN